MAEPTWNLRGIVLADPHPITIPTSPSSSLTTFRDAISHATSIPIASLLLFRPNDPKFSLHDPALRRIQAEATSRHALPTSVSGVIAAATLVGVEEATVGQWFEETVMKVKGHVPDIIHFFVMVAPRSSGSSAARTAAAQQSSAPKPIPHVKTMPVPPVRSESNNNILRIVNLQSDLFKPTSQTSDLSLMSPQSRQPAPPRSGGNVTGATSLDSPPPMSPQGPPPTFQQAMATRARANTGGPSPPPMSQQASASQSQQPLKSGPSNVPPSIMKPTPGPQPQQPPISGSNNPPTSIMKNSPQQFQDSSRPRANTGAPTSPQPTPQGPAPQYQQSPRSQPKSNSPSLDTSPQSPKSPSPQQPSRSGPPSTSPYNTPPMSPQTRSRSNTGILLPQDNPSPPTLQSPSSPNHNYFPPPQPQFQPLPSTSRGRSTSQPANPNHRPAHATSKPPLDSDPRDAQRGRPQDSRVHAPPSRVHSPDPRGFDATMPSVEYRPANHDSRGRSQHRSQGQDHRSQPDGNMPSVEYRPANHDSRGRPQGQDPRSQGQDHRSQPDGNMPSVEYRPANHDSRGRPQGQDPRSQGQEHRSQPDGNMPSVEYRPANHDSRGRPQGQESRSQGQDHRSQPDGNMPSVEYRPANHDSRGRPQGQESRAQPQDPRIHPSQPRPPRDDPRSQPPPDTDYQNYNNRSDSRGRGRSQNPPESRRQHPDPTDTYEPRTDSRRPPAHQSRSRGPENRRKEPLHARQGSDPTRPLIPPGTAATSAGASVNIPTRTNISIAGSDWFRTEGGFETREPKLRQAKSQHQLREGNAAYPEVEGYRKFEKGAADLKGNPKKLKQMFPELSPMEILTPPAYVEK